MDDGLCSVSTVEEAKEIIYQATEICKQGNVRLHKFLSNDKTVLESVPPSSGSGSSGLSIALQFKISIH